MIAIKQRVDAILNHSAYPHQEYPLTDDFAQPAGLDSRDVGTWDHQIARKHGALSQPHRLEEHLSDQAEFAADVLVSVGICHKCIARSLLKPQAPRLLFLEAAIDLSGESVSPRRNFRTT